MRRLVATICADLARSDILLSRLLISIPTDAPRAQSTLLIGAAQILWMDVPIMPQIVDLSVQRAVGSAGRKILAL